MYIDIKNMISSCVDIARQLVSEVEDGNLVVAMGGGLRNFRTKANGGTTNYQYLEKLFNFP